MISYKGRQIPQTFEEIVDPKHTALIVHELLNDLVAAGDCIRPTEPAWLDDAMKFSGRSATVKPHTEIIQAWRARPPA